MAPSISVTSWTWRRIGAYMHSGLSPQRRKLFIPNKYAPLWPKARSYVLYEMNSSIVRVPANSIIMLAPDKPLSYNMFWLRMHLYSSTLNSERPKCHVIILSQVTMHLKRVEFFGQHLPATQNRALASDTLSNQKTLNQPQDLVLGQYLSEWR